ncbi:proprotein convertase P-domain-containing protein [Catenuloplanes japonicus]|uniref:proprotein convertase P-domain-containing protein n=1 Tax=Catenuloplanes japonicus TaxID=33876 RepID=UPI0007C44581|nr:proprotein convertase P-domain-containing protein [Catenuloplanes japonicus]
MNRTLRRAPAPPATSVAGGPSARLRLAAAGGALAVVAAGLISVVTAAPAQAAVSQPLRTMVANLPVATEVRTGYDRDLFNHWIDADGDGCNTRYEVLIAEATTTPSVGSGCALSGGRWSSYYDGATWTDPADLDIDHMVPLAEAWDSGARNWTSAQRQSFANDLGDARTLAAVTDNVNQSKSDQDPAEWMPSVSAVACRYITEWTAVKTRWGLTVDTSEKSKLTSVAAGCTNSTVTVDVVLGGGGGTTPTATATPTGTGGTCAGTNGTDVAIPDSGTVVTSTITISGCSRSAASSTSTIYVNITHPFRGDISIYLYAPDNSYYVLKSASTTDSAADIITTYTTNLSSETANGAWKLSLKDNATGDAGTLTTWTLTV